MKATPHASVIELEANDRWHYNGDPFWDGDQTLWQATLSERGEMHELLLVVPRGDAFIAAHVVRRHLEGAIGQCRADQSAVQQLAALSTSPASGRRPQFTLSIEPPG